MSTSIMIAPNMMTRPFDRTDMTRTAPQDMGAVFIIRNDFC